MTALGLDWKHFFPESRHPSESMPVLYIWVGQKRPQTCMTNSNATYTGTLVRNRTTTARAMLNDPAVA
jgi:hypothetical protein